MLGYKNGFFLYYLRIGVVDYSKSFFVALLQFLSL